MIMKNIFLLTVLFVACILPAFSQLNSRLHNKRLQFDSTFRSFSFDNHFKNFSPGISDNLKWPLNNSFSHRNFRYPKYGDRNLFFRKNTVEIFMQPQSFDPMPCLKPQGFFPMPIYKPDSTVKYTMLIKKIHRDK